MTEKCIFPKCDNEGTEVIDIGDEAGQVLRKVCLICLNEKFL